MHDVQPAFSEGKAMPGDQQGRLFDEQEEIPADVARSLLDQLLTDSKLYKTTESYKELLAFIVRLRNVAPFNAMLLHLQKPGVSYVASAYDWKERFGRWPKEGARPLLILWPFSPVATVYDVLDTEGQPLPEDAATFVARGKITKSEMETFESRLAGKNIEWLWIDAGNNRAGAIGLIDAGDEKSKRPRRYQVQVNENHAPPVQFSTLAHELAHLYLGHLGEDKKLKIPDRSKLPHDTYELEAESVAYLVCERSGVTVKSETYLAHFVAEGVTADTLPLYQITRAAGQIETILNLAIPTKFPPRESIRMTVPWAPQEVQG